MNDTTCHAARLASPLGDLFAVVDHSGALVRLDFVGSKERAADGDDLERLLARRGRELAWDRAALEHVAAPLARYFEGDDAPFELALAPQGTPFQRAVWDALVQVPYGATTTYGELARRIGRPTAARAVGRANGLNPVSIVVPCHRVVGAGGALTGYAGGLDRKRALLALEGAAQSSSSRASAACSKSGSRLRAVS